MAGYDTIVPIDDDDNAIYGIAKSTGRLLLTRDKDLSNRKGISSLRVHSDDIEGQLLEFIKDYHASEDRGTTRCPLCNGVLEAIPRDDVVGLVPLKVQTMHDNFYRCGSCEKIYWSGTHWDRIVQGLSSVGLAPVLPDGPEDKSKRRT
jgi:hypothetical protein